MVNVPGVSSFHGVADSSLRQVVLPAVLLGKAEAAGGPVAKPGRYKTVSVTSSRRLIIDAW
ncbi:MAG TPA: hypothetical protein HPP66_12770 [Planctomycetes bacterium]|nr:hypothetical protein [Planctomycetota bacterium]